jgi:hypothetical protein
MSDKMTLRDPSQIDRYEHEENHDARRVYIVGGNIPDVRLQVPDIKVNIDAEKTVVQTVEVPTIVKETVIVPVDKIVKEVEKIEVPVIVKDIEKIHIPTILKQTEFQEVQKVVTETRVERIEVPVPQIVHLDKVVTNTEYKDLPKTLLIVIAVQATVSIITSLIMLLK